MDLFGEEPSEEILEQEDNLPGDSLASPEIPPLIGHEAVLERFQTALTGGTLPHSILLHGPVGIGKSKLALHMAALLFPKEKQSLVLSGAHPDVFCIERPMDERKGVLKPDLSVDAIRSITRFTRQTPADGGWRVVIIDDGDHMNRAAQNALLKTLEEPPHKTVLILIAHQSGRLLPTIRSRVQLYPAMPLSSEQVAQIVRLHTGEGASPLAYLLSEGSAGEAIRINEADRQEALLALLSLLSPDAGPLAQWTQIKAVAAHQNLAEAAVLLCRFLDLWLLAGDLVLDALPMPEQESVRQWGLNTPLARRLEIRDILMELLDMAKATHLDAFSLARKMAIILQTPAPALTLEKAS